MVTLLFYSSILGALACAISLISLQIRIKKDREIEAERKRLSLRNKLFGIE